MGKNNRFREDALKYWDIKCEDAWTRFEEAVRENPYLTDVINRVAAMGPKATADTCRNLFPTGGRRSSNHTHF